MSDFVGKKLDVYEVIRLIGKGGMGEVYEAKHSIIGRRVAIKLLNPEFRLSKDLLGRMIREARAASAIGHPNITEVQDFRQAPDGTHYMVMELLSGEPLASLIKEHGRLDVAPAVAIMVQALSALTAAHNKGIVHRDMKPDNIFLAKMQTVGYQVKLLDFGISKFTDVADESLRLTKTGAVMGTPYYMSPEQASGKPDIDGRCDLWACGSILYECLTGILPYTGKVYNQVIAAILTEDYKKPTDVRSDLPPELGQVIERALEKNRDKRYATAPEMLEALLPFYPRSEVEVGRFSLQEGLFIKQTLPPARAPRPAEISEEVTTPETTSSRHADKKAASLAKTEAASFPEIESALSSGSSPPRVDPTGETIMYGDDVTGPIPEDPGPKVHVGAAGEKIPTGQPTLGPAEEPGDGQTMSRASRITVPASKRKKLAYTLGGGVLAVLLGVGVMWGILTAIGKDDKKGSKHAGSGGPGATENKNTESRGHMQPDGHAAARQVPDASAPKTAPRRPPPRKQKIITIVLKNLPPWARITLDGVVVGSRIRIPADRKMRELHITAPGRKPFKKRFKAVRNLSIRVKMPKKRKPRPMKPARPDIYKPPY